LNCKIFLDAAVPHRALLLFANWIAPAPRNLQVQTILRLWIVAGAVCSDANVALGEGDDAN